MSRQLTLSLFCSWSSSRNAFQGFSNIDPHSSGVIGVKALVPDKPPRKSTMDIKWIRGQQFWYTGFRKLREPSGSHSSTGVSEFKKHVSIPIPRLIGGRGPWCLTPLLRKITSSKMGGRRDFDNGFGRVQEAFPTSCPTSADGQGNAKESKTEEASLDRKCAENDWCGH